MNHTPAIDIWKGSNRVSNLWEELLASCVSPDPLPEKDPSPPLEPESLSPVATEEMAYSSAGPSLLEKAGFESLRLVRQALEILTAPPEQEPGTQPAVTEAWGLIDKKEITTQVLLDNGETVVIGGVYEQQQTQRVDKIPFFGDLPLLSWMFTEKLNQDDKRELLIFLTPRIMSERLSLK